MADKIEVPVWFWIIAGIGLAWNLMGMWDWYNSITMNAAYLKNFDAEMLGFLKVMPAWAKAAWSIAIICAVTGSLLLLLRKAWAVPVFALGILGMIISFGYQFTTSAKPQYDIFMWLMTAMIWSIALFLLWFAMKAKRKGWTS